MDFTLWKEAVDTVLFFLVQYVWVLHYRTIL